MSEDIKKTLRAIAMVVTFLAIIFGGHYIEVKKEYKSSINFVIDHTTTSVKGLYSFFDAKGTELNFDNYDNYETLDIKSGDLIFKQAYSVPLYIYRKDNADGKYKLHLKLDPVNDFGFYHNEKAVNNPPDAEVDSLYNQIRK